MRRFGMAVLAAALLSAACGSAAEELAERAIERSGDVGDVEIDLDDGDGTVRFESDDQTIVAGADVDLPGTLTIPVPDGGMVTVALEDNSYVSAALQYPQGDFDAVVAFFDGWISSDDRDWSRQEASLTAAGGETVDSVTWVSQGGDLVSVADCTSNSGVYDTTCVTVNEIKR